MQENQVPDVNHRSCSLPQDEHRITAVEGVWLVAPGLALFAALLATLVREEPDGNRPRLGVAAAVR